MTKIHYPLKVRLGWWFLVLRVHGMHAAWLATFVASYHWWPWPWAAWPLILAVIQFFGLWGMVAEARALYVKVRAQWNDNQDLLEDAVREPGDDRPYDRFTDGPGA
jgi:hypothetical protein